MNDLHPEGLPMRPITIDRASLVQQIHRRGECVEHDDGLPEYVDVDHSRACSANGRRQSASRKRSTPGHRFCERATAQHSPYSLLHR